MGTDFSLANGCPGGIRATMGFMIGNKTDGAFLAATGYLKIVAVFYVFCFTGNTFAGYFDGIGRVNIPFIGAVGHITLRVILSWIFVSQFQLNAVAVATKHWLDVGKSVLERMLFFIHNLEDNKF